MFFSEKWPRCDGYTGMLGSCCFRGRIHLSSVKPVICLTIIAWSLAITAYGHHRFENLNYIAGPTSIVKWVPTSPFQTTQATSQSGSDEVMAENSLEKALAEARERFDAEPRDLTNIIWLGRRSAYLGNYREAIDIYTAGLEQFPREARLYRHRGHRYISVRDFDRAVADLEKAAALIRGLPDEVEPDGLPNRYNRPRSTSHSNIWYHLGLAYYLKGDMENALRCYRACMEFSKNDDMLCATSHWLYMTLRRLGRETEAQALLAAIQPEMEILENDGYHRLLLMYKGRLSSNEVSADQDDALTSATEGYGLGNWHYYSGRKDEARAIWKKVTAGSSSAAFGYIAAEADLDRHFSK